MHGEIDPDSPLGCVAFHQSNGAPKEIVQGNHPPVELRRTSKVEELRYDPVQPSNFLHHNVRDLAAAAVFLEPVGENRRKALDGAQGISDLMGHAGGKPAERCKPFASPELFFQLLDVSHVRK